jgi:serine/threonine-protein kinase
MPEPQLQVLGRYKILRVIGRGAMGVVYEAVDPDIDRVVAIKTINLTLSPDEMAQYEARFKQEIKAAGRLNHPNIVTIYDVGKTDNMAYMAMEFINGCELKDLLKAGVPLPIDVALNIIAQAAEGLAFAHSRDIIHRDVKPANIMLLENEEGTVAKITDFGIARMPASAVKTMTGMVMGSPRYMSPEQVIGKNLSARSDIFSLGVVLYESLTGMAPFEADSISSIMYQTVHAAEQAPSSVNANLDPELDAIIAKALAKSPDDRYETMKAFARKLRELIRARAGESPFSLEQLRTSSGMPAATPAPPPKDMTVADTGSHSTAPDDGTRIAPILPVAAPATAEPVIPPQQTAPATAPLAPPPAAAVVKPVPAAPVPVAAPAAPAVKLPTPIIAPAQNEVADRTVWPVAVANQFDSTIATLRLAEITAQTGELSEFISASRQMPAYRELPAEPPPATANQRAAITLTMDPLPKQARKIPTGPLFLLGGLGSTVLILLVAVALTF